MQKAAITASTKESDSAAVVDQCRAALKDKEAALAMIETEVEQLRAAFSEKEAEMSVQRDAAMQARDDAEHKCLSVTIEMEAIRSSQARAAEEHAAQVLRVRHRTAH